MGDIAAILGSSADMTLMRGPPPPAPSAQPRALKLQGLSKEVADLVAPNRRGGGETSVNSDLPMAVPASNIFARALSSTTAQTSVTSSEPASVPSEKRDSVVKVGNKWISASKPARKWVWAPFSSSARTDGLLLHHWVRNVEYPDYPYARFDIHLDPVTYNNDEEYRTHLKDPDWTKGETDQLLQLAKRFELRWPVIYDRWVEHFKYGCTSDIDTPRHRNIEDLQYRFYTVAATLMQLRIKHEATTEAQTLASQTATAAAAAATAEVGRSMDDAKHATDALLIETAAARALASTELPHQPVMHHLGTGTANKMAFDLNYERERRAHLEALWNRTKEEEAEEAELRKELKLVEAQLRKLKKAGIHIAADGSSGGGTSVVSSRNASRAGTPVQFHGTISTSDVPAMLTQAFAASIPTAMAGTPYLQSGRLLPPSVGGGSGINKALRTRMDEVLEELNIKEHPLATKRVCDLYDTVRKDILTLLVLQRTAFQKEGLLASQRLQLAKRGGNAQVVDEETLLGIQSASTGMSTQATSSTRASHGTKTARSGSKLGKTNPTSAKAKSTSTKGKSSAGEGMARAGVDARKDAASTTAATSTSPSQDATTRVPAVSTTVSDMGMKQVRKGSVPGVKRKRNATAATAPPPISQKSPLPFQTIGPTGDALGRPVSAGASVGTEHGAGVALNPVASTVGGTTAVVANAATSTVESDSKPRSKKRPKKSTA